MTNATLQKIRYIVSDFIAVSVAWFVFNVIRYVTLPINAPINSLHAYYAMPTVIGGQLLLPLLMVGLFALSGYYNNPFFKSRLDDTLNTFGISFMGTIAIYFAVLINDDIPDRISNYQLLLILWGLFSVLVYIPRLVITTRSARLIRSGELSFNALIVGTGAASRAYARKLCDKQHYMGLRVVGYVATGSEAADEEDGLPVIPLADVDSVCDMMDINAFVLVPQRGATTGEADHLHIINRLFPTGRHIYITPDLYQVLTSRPRTQMVAGEVLIDVSRPDIPASTWNLKRVGDIVTSFVALVLLIPVYLAIAVAIKVDMPGAPVFYRQQRVGYRKKIFSIIKFRTMVPDAESAGPQLSTGDSDSRITAVGRFLRKYRLDELPQFWNVLVGDMSIVGPRPERQYYVDKIIERVPYYSLIHQVRPGITSWGNVRYGYASNVDQMIERLRYDLIYIENVSFGLDLKILFYTVDTVITGKGL